MSGTFLIAGLGNPGPKYAETRHNAGFWFLDELVAKAGAPLRAQSKLQAESVRATLWGHDCILARPTTFMNHSGQALRALSDYYKIPMSQTIVAYDDLDLPPGVVRLKQGGGHGGHNGLRDIYRHIEDREFIRVRIGIGHPGHKDAVTRYVLSRPTTAVRQVIDAEINRALAVLPDVLDGKLQPAMTKLHTDS